MDSLHAVVSGKSSKPSDYIFGPLSILVFSKRVIDFLSAQIPDEFEMVELPLFSEVGAKIPGFYLVNPLNTISCLSEEESTFIGDGEERSILNPVVDQSKVPIDISMFRVDNLPGSVFFRKDLATSIINSGFNGISFLATESVNDITSASK